MTFRVNPIRVLGLLLAGTLAAQDDDHDPSAAKPRNDGSNCPYCKGDPKLMEASGVVSHGGFEFGTRDTAGTDALLEGTPLYWIETPHFEIGMGVEPYRIRNEDRAKIKRELVELNEVLPGVGINVRLIDPWLRLHIYALRTNALWARVQEILGVSDKTFPAAGEEWRLGEPYHGEGPHLGMGGKFELLILPDAESQERWLNEEFGLRTQRTQRWNIGERQTLTVVINADEVRLRKDAALYGHVAFSLAINMLDGYEFYAYETPVWLREGLAHYVERELDPNFNSFSYSEASLAEETQRADWWVAVKKLIKGSKAPTIAELVHLRTPAGITLPHHYTAWSMTAFLVEEHGAGYACLNAKLHGIRDAQGDADGSAMVDKHRAAFEKCLGMRYHEFDEAWQEWALKQIPRMNSNRNGFQQEGEEKDDKKKRSKTRRSRSPKGRPG